jgi:hypothetical protein
MNRKIKNPSNAYERQVLRWNYLKSIHTESLTLLAMLYGLRFDNGTVKIRDFYNMTMLDVHRELQLRILILNGRKAYKLNKRKEDQSKKQQQAIDEMIAFSG